MAERPAPSTKPVLEKMLLKPGMRAAVIGAPESYRAVLADAPAGVDIADSLAGRFDWIQVFVTRRDEVIRDGPRWREAVQPNGLLWAAYPKGKALPTDLNRDILRVALEEVGLEVVTQVAIDEVWSALRAKRV